LASAFEQRDRAAIADGGPAAVSLTAAEGWWTRRDRVTESVYWGIHASCLLVFWVGASTTDLVLLAVTFYARMFGITGAYHRYFAHKTYKTSRAFQFALAVLACSATQKGPLWWAGNHRTHHKNADQPDDIHSPKHGLYHAHAGWIFEGRWDATPLDRIADFARYPELVWLNRNHHVPPLALAVLCTAVGGFSGLVWGYVVSTVLLWHATYTINSLAHTWGTRRYATSDTSRNNPWLALLTMGEGWHNNHHHFCASARQGFRWWEIDLTYYLLRSLQSVGLIWEVREPPAHVIAAERAGDAQPRKAA
jgi:stearoyl-CoA desaturase (delta-9 desaturase)